MFLLISSSQKVSNVLVFETLTWQYRKTFFCCLREKLSLENILPWHEIALRIISKEEQNVRKAIVSFLIISKSCFYRHTNSLCSNANHSQSTKKWWMTEWATKSKHGSSLDAQLAIASFNAIPFKKIFMPSISFSRYCWAYVTYRACFSTFSSYFCSSRTITLKAKQVFATNPRVWTVQPNWNFMKLNQRWVLFWTQKLSYPRTIDKDFFPKWILYEGGNRSATRFSSSVP